MNDILIPVYIQRHLIYNMHLTSSGQFDKVSIYRGRFAYGVDFKRANLTIVYFFLFFWGGGGYDLCI